MSHYRSIVIILSALYYSFSFNYSMSSDDYVFIVRGISLANPDFALNDWFINTFSYHFIFDYLVSFFYSISSSENWFFRVFFSSFVFLHFVMALSFYQLFKNKKYGYFLWVIFLLFFRVLINKFFFSFGFMLSYSPERYASILLLISFSLIIMEHINIGIFILSLAALFHLNTFLLISILLFFIILYSWIYKKIKVYFILGILFFLICSIPNIYIILKVLAFPKELIEKSNEIMRNVRSPFHYSVRDIFNRTYIINFYILNSFPLIFLIYTWWKNKKLKISIDIYLYLVIFFLINFWIVLMNFYPINFVRNLHIGRLTPYVLFIGFYIFVSNIPEFLSEIKKTLVFIFIFFSILCLIVSIKLYIPLIILTAILSLNFFLKKRLALNITALIVLIVFFNFSNRWKTNLNRFIQPSLFYMSEHYRPVYSWIKNNTPIGSIILISKKFHAVRFFTQRAIVVNFKNFPVMPVDTIEWYNRIKDLDYDDKLKTNSKASSNIGYESKNLNELSVTAKKYGASFVIIEKKYLKEEDANKMYCYKDDEFIVYRINI